MTTRAVSLNKAEVDTRRHESPESAQRDTTRPARVLEGASQRRRRVEELARTQGARVLRAAYRVLGEQSAAEDVQQEVFLRLLRRPPPEVRSWPALLTTMATRMAIDRLRRRQRRSVLLRWLPVPEEPVRPDAIGTGRELAGELRAALDGLSKRECEVFCLRYLNEVEVGEIAHLLSITENNVAVVLHRARRKLATRLQRQQEMSR